MKIHFYLLIFTICFFINSCLYEAGNRKPDLNYHLRISINSFYVEKFLKNNFMKVHYIDQPLTSELVNYPKDFVPLIDSINGFKYVIECRVGTDSISNDGWGLSLCSLYDMKKQKWIKERDSLVSGEIQIFEKYFKKTILEKVIDEFQGKIPDSTMFNAKILEID